MNGDELDGKWKPVVGKLRSKWAKLTDDDWALIGSRKDQLVGKPRERYGHKKDDAEQKVDDDIRSLS